MFERQKASAKLSMLKAMTESFRQSVSYLEVIKQHLPAIQPGSTTKVLQMSEQKLKMTLVAEMRKHSLQCFCGAHAFCSTLVSCASIRFIVSIRHNHSVLRLCGVQAFSSTLLTGRKHLALRFVERKHSGLRCHSLTPFPGDAGPCRPCATTLHVSPGRKVAPNIPSSPQNSRADKAGRWGG